MFIWHFLGEINLYSIILDKRGQSTLLSYSTGVRVIYGIPSMALNNILVKLVKNHCDGGGQRLESPD